jgi:pimeloyl-ACP methyl ester carboxylesterase
MHLARLWPRIRRVWITLGVSATVVFAGWSAVAYRASPAARAATTSDAAVAVRHVGGTWQFTPRRLASAPPLGPGLGAAPGLVFFPGALVEPAAYAPLARAAAAAGFPAYIVELPRRGAFGGADDPELGARLRRVLGQPGAPARWLVAGHSRGGVVASRVAAARPAGLAGARCR